jgi:hypothetical protein
MFLTATEGEVLFSDTTRLVDRASGDGKVAFEGLR